MKEKMTSLYDVIISIADSNPSAKDPHKITALRIENSYSWPIVGPPEFVESGRNKTNSSTWHDWFIGPVVTENSSWRQYGKNQIIKLTTNLQINNVLVIMTQQKLIILKRYLQITFHIKEIILIKWFKIHKCNLFHNVYDAIFIIYDNNNSIILI